MKRNTLNFVIDATSALVMVGMIATGLLLRFVLPPGSGSRRMLWIWGRHDWGDLRFRLAVGVGAPQDVAADEQLGRLAAKYNFSMQQARERLGERVAHAGNE